MVDADGATDIKELEVCIREIRNLEEAGSSPGSMVVGSRAHMEEDSKAKRTLVRTLLMQTFHVFVSILVPSKVRDTQCGFKLFNKIAGEALFANLHLERWAFDIEIIALADKMGFSVKEVPVKWTEVEGSKLDQGKISLLVNSVGMLRDMLCVRICYDIGLWTLKAS